jgi:hypothetical protein
VLQSVCCIFEACTLSLGFSCAAYAPAVDDPLPAEASRFHPVYNALAMPFLIA